MKIVVCVKQVPDTTEIKINPQTGTLIREGVPSILNPDDASALEAALEIKDTEKDAHITVITMGPPQAKDMLAECLAMGADEAILLSDRALGGSDTWATSNAIAAGIKKIGDYDLILAGRQAIDGDTAQVGSEISEALSLPAVAGVLRILSAEAEAITVEMDLTDKVETVRVSLPCLLSVEKDIAQPRLPSYVRKQAMKDAPIHRLTLSDMEDTDAAHYGLSGSPTQVQRIFPPESNHKQEKWTGTGPELAGRLFGLLKEQKLWQGGR